MIIVHVSDNHSVLYPLPKEGDVVVHTGDFLPNASRGKREIEVPFQTEWLKLNADRIKNWIDNRPFLFSYGNHDFCPNICDILQDHGIDAHDITSTVYEFGGLKFYGFPFIPFLAGEWNGECFGDQMQREVRRIKDVILEHKVDILCAHCPIYGILDLYLEEHCGNQQLADLLSYGIDRDKWPKALLCGHVHEGNGITDLDGMLVSNAATTVHLLDIK